MFLENYWYQENVQLAHLGIYLRNKTFCINNIINNAYMKYVTWLHINVTYYIFNFFFFFLLYIRFMLIFSSKAAWRLSEDSYSGKFLFKVSFKEISYPYRVNFQTKPKLRKSNSAWKSWTSRLAEGEKLKFNSLSRSLPESIINFFLTMAISLVN